MRWYECYENVYIALLREIFERIESDLNNLPYAVISVKELRRLAKKYKITVKEIINYIIQNIRRRGYRIIKEGNWFIILRGEHGE